MPFDLLLGVAVGDGLGEAFFRFGEVSGDGVGVGFFFRCLRAGVGDGSKAFLIFVPSDSWAEDATLTAPKKIAKIKSHFMTRCCSVRCPQRRIESIRSAGCPEDSASYSTRRSAGSPRRVRPVADRMPAGPTDKMSVLRLRELLKDGFVEANSAFEVFERKIFVW